MPEITAAQLATLWQESQVEALSSPMRVKRLDLVCALTDNVDFIIACLYEHESRAAVQPVSDHYKLPNYVYDPGWKLPEAKASASSLVRCGCVDANGNPYPDCTCDHGWRQAAVEKAVRNG